jgi:predicted Zn-dependent peptidase
MGNKLSYEERMAGWRKIVTEIQMVRSKIQELDEELENLKKQPEKTEKPSKIKEKSKLIDKLNRLNQSYIKIGIPVPENGGYEIENGLLGMKQDINIKTTEYLNDEKIKQVFIFISLYFF